jgi:formylglycine-generating enzyme required for sulfatase activity
MKKSAIWSVMLVLVAGGCGRQVDTNAPPQRRAPVAHETAPAREKVVTNSIGMKLVLIPAGEFMMGSPDSDVKAEKPQHPVRITKPFYLGVNAVTQEQYERLMSNNPSYFKGDPQRPVETVAWDDAVAFCQTLSKKEGVTYRLPTEAEWEYACRAGTTTRYGFGDDPKNMSDYAWCKQNSDGNTHPVGQKKPNAWGLYDMHGNVYEWCADRWGVYADSPVTNDPVGPGSGDSRVLRGCFWSIDSPDYPPTCASRLCFRPGPGSNVGFRVARTITSEPTTKPDLVSNEPDIPAPHHVSAPQAPREILRIADKVLTLVHVERIESMSADITNIPSEQVERAIRLGSSVTNTKDRGPLSDSKSFHDLLNGSTSGSITFVLRWGQHPNLETLVAALGEPERRVPGTIQYQNRAPMGSSPGFPAFPTSELLQVEWYHWAWVAIAVGTQNNFCWALRIDPKRWRETHKE